MKLNQLKVLLRNKTVISILFFTVVDLILLGSAIYGGMRLYQYYQQIQLTRSDVDTLQKEVQLIRLNKKMLEHSISDYNSMLGSLIPDEETYFKVIAALEQLETRTGVTVDSYTLNLSDTTEEKLSLSLSVVGSRESIEKLLKDYNYTSGRLLTNEIISVSFDDPITMAFQINLVHRPFDASVEDGSTQISQEDVSFLQEVQEQFAP